MNKRSKSGGEVRFASLGQLLSLTVGLALMLAVLGAPSAASAGAEGRRAVLPRDHPQVPQTMIACFDGQTHRSTGKVRPRACEISGRLEFAGYLEGIATKNVAHGSLVRLPIKGIRDHIRWDDEWGAYKSRGNEAVNARTGRRFGVTVYRRVRCADGSVWYSRADVFDLNSSYLFVVQLPVCEDRASARS
jgi:hypothetical protein